MKPALAVVLSAGALWTALGAAALGCAHRTTPARCAPQSRAPETTAPHFESSVPSPEREGAADGAQRRAQQAWCGYLDVLYHRATRDGTAWSDLGKCNAATATATPAMLERTASCARQALDAFSGDPFSDAYAAEVKRCGVTALDALALTPAELDPYVSLVCERGPGHLLRDSSGCRADVTVRLGHKMARALGSINAESRISFRQCIQASSTEDIDDRISECLDPILEKLLWTPG
jgi:hypothetical protein